MKKLKRDHSVPFSVFVDFYSKICYNSKQIAKRAKKRFYFNVLKNGKKQIIIREKKEYLTKFISMKERLFIQINFIILWKIVRKMKIGKIEK